MVEIQRIDYPEICLECGGGDGDLVLSTANSSLSICDGCGALCVRVDREEGDGVTSYFHWFSPMAITAALADDDEEENPEKEATQ